MGDSSLHGNMQGSARQLELAAAEMAEAAAKLVHLENTLLTESQDGGDGAAVPPDLEQSRQEAAAVLERKMAAMEAVLAARRTPLAPAVEEPKPEPETPADKVMKQMQMPVHTSTGPAAGTGHELVLQVCPSSAAPRCSRCTSTAKRLAAIPR